METTLTAEDLVDLNPEQLIERLLQENQEKVTLAQTVKEKEQAIIQTATKLNATKKEKEEVEQEANKLKEERSPEKVSSIVEQTLDRKEVNRKVDNVVNQLPDDIKEQFKNQYKEIVGDRHISPAEVDKFINAALSIVSPDIKPDANASLAIGGGQTGAVASQKKQEDDARTAYAKNFFGN